MGAVCRKNVGGGFWEAGKVLLLFFFLICFLAASRDMWNLSSLPRDWTRAPEMEVQIPFSYKYLLIFDGAVFAAGWLLSCCREWGCSLAAVFRLLTGLASPAAVFTGSMVQALNSLWHVGSAVVAGGLYSTGLVTPRRVGTSRTGIRPVSPALAGRSFTTEPPGKPEMCDLTSCLPIFASLHPCLSSPWPFLCHSLPLIWL